MLQILMLSRKCPAIQFRNYTFRMAGRLVESGVKVFIVGMGNEVNDEAMEAIASDNDNNHLIRVPSVSDVTSLIGFSLSKCKKVGS